MGIKLTDTKIAKIVAEVRCSIRGYHKVSVYSGKCLDCKQQIGGKSNDK
jgi:hypothetical protein